jgi:hypothetical protein
MARTPTFSPRGHTEAKAGENIGYVFRTAITQLEILPNHIYAMDARQQNPRTRSFLGSSGVKNQRIQLLKRLAWAVDLRPLPIDDSCSLVAQNSFIKIYVFEFGLAEHQLWYPLPFHFWA